MLWVDKYRPSKLDDLSYHGSITNRLQSFANHPSTMPHLFFYGPSGSGKKTRIYALLRALFGPGAERIKLDKRVFTTPTNRTIELNLLTSNYHIELCPGDAGIHDRYVVQDIIKEMASNKNIASAATSSSMTTTNDENSNTMNNNKADFKVVVLVEVDKLTRQAQAALRRTMEKCSSSCRLILCCNSQAKVIEPVRSRCFGIRVGTPSPDHICSILTNIAQKENLPGSLCCNELGTSIAQESNCNLRKAILMFEACSVQKRNHPDSSSSDSGGIVIQKTDWELYIAQLAVEITREQTPQRLMAAREKLYELLVNCIPANIIIKTLVQELMKNLDDSIKGEVMEWAAFYEHRIALGSKEIFHLEAFIAKYMAIYKRYLNELFA